MNENPSSVSKPKRGAFGVVFLTIFLDMVGFSVIFPLFPEMLDHYLEKDVDGGLLTRFVSSIQHLGFTSENAGFRIETVIFGGVLGSLFAILQFLFAPIWGHWSDRIGRRPIMLISVGGTCLGYLVWIFAGNFWALVLSRVVGGMASGNLSVATAAIADVTPRETRAKGMALVGIAFGLGFILGPAIGGLAWMYRGELSQYQSLGFFALNPFSGAGIASFLLALLNFLWLALRFRETLPIEKRDTQRPGKPGIFQLGKVENIPVRRSCLAYFFYMISFSGMEFTLTFLAVERFVYTPADNTRMFLLIGLTLIIAQGVLVRRLVGPVGERNLALCGVIFGALAFCFLAAAGEETFFYVGLLLMSVGVAFTSPTLTALASLHSSESSQGFHLGVFRSSGSLARAIGPLLAGVAYFQFGSALAYASGAVLLILPAIFLFRIDQPEKV